MPTPSPTTASPLPSLKAAIKALPMKYEAWSQKEHEYNRQLKKRISALEKDKIRQQKARLLLKMQPYLEFEQKLMDDKGPTDFFDQQIQKPLEKCIAKWIKVLKAHPFDEGVYHQLQEMDDVAFSLLGKNAHILEKKWIIDELIKRPLVPSGVLMVVNDEYTHVPARKRFATAQLQNTLGFFKDSCNAWPYELDMISMYLSDGVDHYHLGVELLLGDPKKINQASSMDTASREHIDSKAWDFIIDDLWNGEYKKDEGIVLAKKEKKMLEALPAAPHTKPTFRL